MRIDFGGNVISIFRAQTDLIAAFERSCVQVVEHESFIVSSTGARCSNRLTATVDGNEIIPVGGLQVHRNRTCQSRGRLCRRRRKRHSSLSDEQYRSRTRNPSALTSMYGVCLQYIPGG